MSAKDNILTPPKPKQVQEVKKPVATSQANQAEVVPAEPIVKKESPNVTPTQLSKALDIDASMERVPDKSILPADVAQAGKLSDEEIRRRKVAAYRKQIDEMSGLTEEERKKQEKARNIQAILATVGDGVSALANLHYTSQYAPNVKQSSALKGLQDRWDKEDKERKGEAREAMSFYQQMDAVQRAEDAMRYRKERDKVADERHAAEVEYRKQKDKEDREARAEAARVEGERWKMKLDQDKKIHEDNLAERKRKNDMDNARAIATAQDKNTIPVFLSDTEEVRVPKHILNNKDRIAEVYEALPDNLKEQAIKRYATVKETKYDREKGEDVTIYKPMTWQQMQQAVGAFIADPEAVKAQNLARRMAGEDAPKGLGWGATEHTTDDEQTDW